MKKTQGRQEPLWRDEFSLDAATERYVARRQFSKFLVLTSLAMFVGNLWILVRNWFAATPSFQPQDIGPVDDIGVGEVKLFSYPTAEDPCILVRGEDGSFQAFSQVCTHLACAVIHRPEEKTLFCPCHHGYFSAEDGEPTAGPPTRRLPRIRLEQRGEELWATGVEV